MKRRIPILPEAPGPATGTVEPNDSMPVVKNALPRSLLVFGESTAAGVGARSHNAGIAGALSRELALGGSPVLWSVIARTGYTSAVACAELLPRLSGFHDDVVVLLGVNDTLALTRSKRWRHDIISIIEAVQHHLNPGGRIVLAGVPQISGFQALPQPTRALLGWHARSLDAVLREIADTRAHVFHVASPGVPSRGLLAADGFHPSEAGYLAWAAQLAPALRRPNFTH
ncbi:SGNH/GDSL hydrolase family protein [Homoserinimonas sp. OAct 916]|uniref:SGNH/GDSL hydrolase family protein n=1 Tax=Homoserinimonas sp. OAct 916 TaxID=2211450 RepID=UPI0013002AE4|nr:SGNH/GDSL hydrolase family protein [Homoserinimonas sp. OAct 916]